MDGSSGNHDGDTHRIYCTISSATCETWNVAHMDMLHYFSKPWTNSSALVGVSVDLSNYFWNLNLDAADDAITNSTEVDAIEVIENKEKVSKVMWKMMTMLQRRIMMLMTLQHTKVTLLQLIQSRLVKQ